MSHNDRAEAQRIRSKIERIRRQFTPQAQNSVDDFAVQRVIHHRIIDVGVFSGHTALTDYAPVIRLIRRLA